MLYSEILGLKTKIHCNTQLYSLLFSNQLFKLYNLYQHSDSHEIGNSIKTTHQDSSDEDLEVAELIFEQKEDTLLQRNDVGQIQSRNGNLCSSITFPTTFLTGSLAHSHSGHKTLENVLIPLLLVQLTQINCVS